VLGVVVACGNVKPTLCEHYFSACHTEAERPDCERLEPAPGVHIADPERLSAKVAIEDVRSWIGNGDEVQHFTQTLTEADEVWYYDDRWRMGRALLGSEGLVAIRGCEAIGLFLLATYN
jgi:hypothetical protein